MSNIVQAPFQNFTGLDGRPLTNGKVYIGQVATDPTVPANQIPVFWDEDLTIPASQPLQTNAGYIVRMGTPTRAYVATDYSLSVLNSSNVLVFYVQKYGVVNLSLYAKLSDLASSIGSSLIGFIQSGAGAILRTVQDKLRERVTIEDFGGVGDGVTDNSTFAQKARESLPNGGVLELGIGTFIIGTDASLSFDVPNITLRGQGSATIIKAKNGAGLTTLVTSSAAGFVIKDLVLDGNRDNGGMAVGSYGLYLGASNTTARGVEGRFMESYASFIGSSVATPKGIVIDDCWFHDNGGTTTTVGFGVGIYAGGPFKPDGLTIQNCHFENNYNIVAGFPGDSTAVNLTASNIIFDSNFVKNNHNKQGGQVVFSSGAPGSDPGRFVISDNTLMHDVIVTNENTAGIEVEGRKVTITGNTIKSLNGDGITMESSGGEAVINGNVIEAVTAAINLIAAGGTGIQKTLVSDNVILSSGTGIQVQPNPGNVLLIDNYIDASVSNRIVGAQNCTLIRGNYGFDPSIQSGLVAGASPYTYPVLNYDAVYSLQTAGGIFSANVDGVNVSFTALVPIPVKAGHVFKVFWATTAPTYSMYPQQ